MGSNTLPSKTETPVPPSAEGASLAPGMPELELRDYFAAFAMNGMIGRTGTYQFSDHYRTLDDARKCYAVADAMLKAREETRPER